MQEEKEHNPADSPDGDAASSETLSDVEEGEKVSEESGEVESSALLSPDGSTDVDKSGRDPKDDVGQV